MLADRDGDDSWPIVGVSFALIHQRQDNAADAVATLDFIHWIYTDGADLARKLHYVMLDPALVRRIEMSWGRIHDEEGRALWNVKP